MDSTRSKRTHRQGYPSGLGRQWLCDCEAESVTDLGAMSASPKTGRWFSRTKRRTRMNVMEHPYRTAKVSTLSEPVKLSTTGSRSTVLPNTFPLIQAFAARGSNFGVVSSGRARQYDVGRKAQGRAW